MSRPLSRLLWLLVLLILAAALFWWWKSTTAPTSLPANASLQAPAAPESAGILPGGPLEGPLPGQEPAPEVLHPIEEPAESDATRLPPSNQAFEEQVLGVVGADLFQRWFLSERLVDRFVATVDNLARSHASPRLWPIPRTPGVLALVEIDGKTYLAPDNAKRYDGFISLIERLPLSTVVALYQRNYPAFQKAYQSLGYPNAYFNDRLVAVIDHLIATPDIAEPVSVHQVEVKGPLADSHPLTHYAFTDAQLEAGSAGRKMLWRMSATKRQIVIARLKQLRQALTTASAPG